MARLRGTSDASYSNAATKQLQRSQVDWIEPPTRRSPRKKTTKKLDEPVELGNVPRIAVHQIIMLEETPKCSAKPAKFRKQVRLAPLNSLQSVSAFFPLGSEMRGSQLPAGPSARRSLVKHGGRTAFRPPVPLKATQTPSDEQDLECRVQPEAPCRLESPQPDSDHRSAGLSLPEEPSLPQVEALDEFDIKQSIWCGSDASTDASEDELPSPRKLLEPFVPRPQSQNSSADPCVVRELDELRISGSPPTLPLPRFSRRAPTEEAIQRPTSSSSEGQYNPRAVLRFSPPRLHSGTSDALILSTKRPTTPPLASPTKGRLVSPSKRPPIRVPTPPGRPSLDTFWNVEAINDWNDQYSPKKEWSPRKIKQQQDTFSGSPTSSPRKTTISSPTKRTKAEVTARKMWETRKHILAGEFLAELDHRITDKQVFSLSASTGGVKLIWSKTLTSTAGRANWRRETTKTRQADGTVTATAYKHFVSIELAEKVIDDEARLMNVLAHEFCHLANFMVSGIKDQPHGTSFKAWGRKATAAFAARGVEVTTKHSYEIDYKYVWRCDDEGCNTEFKRHSKSVDVKRHTCGKCRGKLVQIKPVPRGGGTSANAGGETAVGGYAGFVKTHFAIAKRELPRGASQKEIMEAVGRKYRAEKQMVPPRMDLTTDEVEIVGERKVPVNSATEDVDRVARILDFITLDD